MPSSLTNQLKTNQAIIDMDLERDFGSQNQESGLARAAAQLGAALERLEQASASSRGRTEQQRRAAEQRFEHHLQSLKVQAAHWKQESEKQTAYWKQEAERQTAALVELHRHQSEAQRAELDDWRQKAAQGQEKAQSWKAEAEKQATTLAELYKHQSEAQRAEIESWRQKAAQWQEKAQSWKEEARRAEEARVAALHNVGSAEVKALASEVSESIDNAISHVRSALNRKMPSAGGAG